MRVDRSWSWRLVMSLFAMALVAPTTAAVAQEATPATGGETIFSQTREDVRAEIDEAYAFEEPANTDGTFIDSAISDIQSLNPLLAEETSSIAIAGLIYDSLVGSSPLTGQPAPTGLADSWEIAPDGMTYTFNLNTDAVWHDGVDVTAEDVQFSFDALADERTQSVYTGSFNNAVASYEVIDENTFQVVANEPSFTFLYDLVTWIVPKHIWEDVPFEDWASDPASTGQDPSRIIGSGPFTFQEWVQGDSVTLTRNDEYFGVVPNIGTYIYRVWPDQTARVNALLNGEVDAAFLEPADVPIAETADGVNVETYQTRGFTYLEFNLDPEVTTLFQDRKVRQALFYAMDREAIVNDILLGNAEVARGTQPVISYAFDPEQITSTYDFNPERAKELLAEAGWTDTNGDGTVDKDGQEMAFEYLYPAGSPTNDQVAAYLQDAWQEIGVTITPRGLEFAALIEATTTDPSFEMAQYGFFWDATFIQDAMFGCDQYQVGFNDMKYCNPDLDEIHDQARVEFDDEARAQLLIEASNIVNEDVPVMVTWFSKENLGYQDRVHNFFPGPWDGPGLSYVWVEE